MDLSPCGSRGTLGGGRGYVPPSLPIHQRRGAFLLFLLEGVEAEKRKAPPDAAEQQLRDERRQTEYTKKDEPKRIAARRLVRRHVGYRRIHRDPLGRLHRPHRARSLQGTAPAT